MGKRLIDVTGQKFGKWFVIQRLTNIELSTKNQTQARWFCRCACGTIRLINSQDLRNGATTNCGCDKTQSEFGDKNRNWKGGRRQHNGGYVWVSNAEFPGALPGNRTLEHVVIMSRRLGRPLRKGETIHHKNGVRNDNRDDNLELWPTSHPRGQRIEDKVKWATELLALYAPDKLKGLQ